MNTKFIQSICHNLRPIVIIGSKGITPNIIEEIDRALKDHELIKIKINQADRRERLKSIGTISKQLSAKCVMNIGKTACLLRRSQPTPKRSCLTQQNSCTK